MNSLTGLLISIAVLLGSCSHQITKQRVDKLENQIIELKMECKK